MDKQKGTILLSLVIILPFMIIIVASYLNLSVASLNVARKDQYQTYSQFAADAGADIGLKEINEDDTWTGTAGEVDLLNNGTIRTTYETSVVDVSAEERTIVSVGRTYFPASSTSPRSSITINVDMRLVSSGNFSIVTGVGGLVMTNSSRVLGGEVFINGTLNMSNTSQIGLSTDPVTVYAAHQNCPNPPDSTYPAVCASGENGEPITMNHTAHIYGDVFANNQADGSGMSDNGLQVGQDGDGDANNTVEPRALPDHDRAAQVAAVTNDMTGTEASCSGSESKTWPANTKITGDVQMQNTCTITVEGDVWITGSLQIQNTSTMNMSDLVGDREADIMVDSNNGIQMNNSGTVNPNIYDRGARFITYWSRASCSPDCASVTGQDLFDSREDETIAIDNSVSASSSIFYARWTQVTLKNSTGVGALVGQTVELNNSASITFGTSAGIGTSYWVIDGYRRSF